MAEDVTTAPTSGEAHIAAQGGDAPAPVTAEVAPAVEAAPAEPKQSPVAGIKTRAPRKAPVAKAPVAKLPVAPVAAPKRKPVAKTGPAAPSAQPAVGKAKVVSAKPTVLPKISKTAPPKAKTTPIIKAKSVPRPKPLSEIFPMTTDFTAAIKTTLADVQGKAKAAYAKGASSLTEAGTFAKGNAEAVVESGKILAGGLQKLGTEFVAESRGAFETLTAEAKELAAVKTPTDFFKLQSELMRKHFDSAIAFGSKQTEAMVQLSTESMAPLSRRMTLAMEAIKKAA